MSTIMNKITRHPVTKEYEITTWHDDYFGPHLYGIEFESDGKIYPESLVQESQLKEFWADDVINAFQNWISNFTSQSEINEKTIEFLKELNKVYRLRWKNDPFGGDGAVENLINKREK